MKKIRDLDSAQKEIVEIAVKPKGGKQLEMTNQHLASSMQESVQYDPAQDFGIFGVGDPTKGGN